MNLQDILLIATILIIFAIGLNIVFVDMTQKKLNLADEDLSIMSNTQIELENQQKYYDKSLGEYSINYSLSPKSLAGYNFEGLMGFGIFSGLFDIGGVFGGFTALIKALFPTTMTGYLLWVISLIISIFSIFAGFEIYYTIRGSKQK